MRPPLSPPPSARQAAISGRAACAMKLSWPPTAATAPASGGEPVRVIGNQERSGKGRGVREAMALARGNIAGYADADNKVPIEEFDKFRPWLSPSLSQRYDVAIGSRSMQESQIERRQPLYRQLGGKGFGLF